MNEQTMANSVATFDDRYLRALEVIQAVSERQRNPPTKRAHIYDIRAYSPIQKLIQVVECPQYGRFNEEAEEHFGVVAEECKAFVEAYYIMGDYLDARAKYERSKQRVETAKRLKAPDYEELQARLRCQKSALMKVRNKCYLELSGESWSEGSNQWRELNLSLALMIGV